MMSKQDVIVTNALRCLFDECRIFGSEADFQFALAWKVKELYPEVRVRLEYIPWSYDKNMHIDIVLFVDDKMIPIELKYKTKGFNGTVGEELVSLKNQSAQDVGRYDFLYDVQRMERIVDSGQYPICEAYAIMLTNDPSYWCVPKRDKITVDAEFRIHSGTILSGEMNWKEEASLGTKRNREEAITLRGKYPIAWCDYTPIESCPFKYTVVKVCKE